MKRTRVRHSNRINEEVTPEQLIDQHTRDMDGTIHDTKTSPEVYFWNCVHNKWYNSKDDIILKFKKNQNL